MSIFRKEKGGEWFVRYRDINGKQKQVKAGATKALAQELERKILAERDLQKRFGYTKTQSFSYAFFDLLCWCCLRWCNIRRFPFWHLTL